MTKTSVYTPPFRKTYSERYSCQKASVASMGTVETATQCDYLGITHGATIEDKFERSGLQTTKSEFVNAPLIDEFPFAVEFRVKSYNPETQQLIGKIVNVGLDESILGENGKVSFDKFYPLGFDCMTKTYLALGDKAGNADKDGLEIRQKKQIIVG